MKQANLPLLALVLLWAGQSQQVWMKYIPNIALLCLLLIGAPELLSAQSNLIVDTTEVEVLVTAHRQETSNFAIAEAVSVLPGSRLLQQNSRSTPEALIGLAGVWVQKTNHGGGSPFIRGLTGNQTLLLLDGVRLNNSTYRYGPNQYFNTIDALSIGQVEVVRGGGSVLFGSDALGGTINVLTRSPSFSSEGEVFRVGLQGRVISHGMEVGWRPEVEYNGQNVAFLAGYSQRDFGDILAGGELGKLISSSYQEQAVDLKSKIKTGANAILTLAYNGVFQSEVGRYDQVAQRGYQLYQFDPQNRELAYAKWEIASKSPLWQQLSVTASWQNSREERDKQREGSTILQQESDEIRTFGLSLALQSSFGAHWQAVSGVELYEDEIRSSAFDLDQSDNTISPRRGLYPAKANALNWAIYNSWTYQDKAWTLNGGLRFNGFQLATEDEQFTKVELSPTALVGQLSLRYALHAQHALTAGLYSAFRAPNINDLSSFGSFDFGIEVPTGDLKPERSLNMEVGYKYESANAEARLQVFRMNLSDLIDRVRGSYQGQSQWEGQDVYYKANVASAYIQGIEADGAWRLSRWLKAYANMTYTFGENKAAEEPLRRIPPFNGQLSLAYQGEAPFSAQLQYGFAAKQHRLSGGDISDHRIDANGTPAWSVLNFNLGYQFPSIGLNGGIQNIFNEAYRIHGSGVDGVGRSFWLSLRWNWQTKRSK